MAAAGAQCANAATVEVREQRDPLSLTGRGAIGLLVAGKGAMVSRANALRALRGARAERCSPCDMTITLSLPPRGEHHNVKRYGIAIVGDRYHGLLVSDRTRVDGLISIFDVEPTVRALEHGEAPPITSRAEPRARAYLRGLDARLAAAHHSRLAATLALVSMIIASAVASVIFRSVVAGRAGILVAPLVLVTCLALSGLGIRSPGAVAPVLAVGAGGAALAGGLLLRGRALAVALVALIALYGVVIGVWPETNALAAIGPHPDGGVRFYGVTNEVETLLLAPALVAGALLPLRLLPGVAALALVTVGWSRTGADGGGLLVFAAGFAALAVLELGVARSRTRIAIATAVAAVLALGLVGLDAAFGGSSHVTRAVDRGPGGLTGELGHRIADSAHAAVSSWYHVGMLLIAATAFTWLLTRRLRFAVVDALLVAIAVSLLVNDSPVDVAGWGALLALIVYGWNRACLERGGAR